MNITLTPEQINLINQKQAVVQATRLEASHAEEKLNLLITGIASGKGVNGSFNCTISGDELIISFPEPPTHIEE